MAILVGYASQRAYSEVELGLKRPALGPALACCILFKASLHELFPELGELVERDVLARAKKLTLVPGPHRNREIAASHIADLMSRLSKANQPDK